MYLGIFYRLHIIITVLCIVTTYQQLSLQFQNYYHFKLSIVIR